MRPVRIGTRGSALALWQARAVATALEHDAIPSELVVITTRGDAKQDAPLSAIGGKGVFVAEIHDALRREDIDLAVHSAKDMAAVSPDGLTIAAVLAREDARDALVFPTAQRPIPKRPIVEGFSPGPWKLEVGSWELAHSFKGAIGTDSPRRVAQLRRIYPQARFESIRGNVDTRLRKLDAGEADMLVLACAGLRRLGLADRISAPVAIVDCVPAPGQGIIAIEVRADDERSLAMARALNNREARTALAAEQAVVAALGGGCQLPLGVFAELRGNDLALRAVAASIDGSRIVHGETTGNSAAAVEIGTRLAQDLAARGAMELLHS
ncbi:MAG: hydroxymethylbilane synthase [Acidobacteriota bacterium]|nr:hydroxymethylbilane synthase [Acidobacteriota bacterium]